MSDRATKFFVQAPNGEMLPLGGMVYLDSEPEVNILANEHVDNFKRTVTLSFKSITNCYGRLPYQQKRGCNTCKRVNDCIKEKIKNNFNRGHRHE